MCSFFEEENYYHFHGNILWKKYFLSPDLPTLSTFVKFCQLRKEIDLKNEPTYLELFKFKAENLKYEISIIRL